MCRRMKQLMDEVLTPQGAFKPQSWSADERIELFRQILKFGCNWTKIHIQGRKISQVRTHYYSIKKERILNECELRFVQELIHEYGPDPRFIASVIRYDQILIRDVINDCLAQVGEAEIREWPHEGPNQPDFAALTEQLSSIDLSIDARCKKHLGLIECLLAYQMTTHVSEFKPQVSISEVTREEHEEFQILKFQEEPDLDELEFPLPDFQEEPEIPEWLTEFDEMPKFSLYDMH